MEDYKDVVFNKKLLSKYKNVHTEEKFWNKMKKVGAKIGVAPIYLVFLLYHSFRSNSISLASKLPMAGGLGYFISLVDVIPDLTPIIGYCDDASMMVGALALIAAQLTEEIRNDAKISTRKILPYITDEEFSKIDSLYEKSGDIINTAYFIKQQKTDTRNK